MPRARAIASSAVGGAIAALLIADLAFAQDHGMGDGFNHRHGDGGMMLLFPLLLLAAVGVLVYVLWRGRHPATAVGVPAAPPSPTLNAQSILADRLARGEISPDDYRAAISVLVETPTAQPAG
ncbi:MAG: hypothetical protein ABI894_02435 [Ilumatobacteraceae bacterium]